MTEPRYPFVHVEVRAEEAELVSDQLWGLGAQGLEERDETTLVRSDKAERVLLVASFADEASAHRALAQLEHPARVELVIGDEWRHEWRKHFKPSKVGPRLWVRPSWEELEPEEGDTVLVVDPGGAFGSGIHETTRLVLREIDRRARGGETVADIGCGSGILSIAALLLGAKHATAVDVDPDSVRITMENAEINGVADRVAASTKDVSELAGEHELVLANIQAPILIGMAEPLSSLVAAGGTLVLSGILDGQQDEVAAAFSELEVESMPQEGEWRAIVLRR